MFIGEVNVKISYAGQQQVCDLCSAPGHIAWVCPKRNKCFQCGLEGHFSRDCPQCDGYRDPDSVLDPTTAEAAAAIAFAAAPPDLNDVLLCDDADSLDGVSLTYAAGRAMDSQLDADTVSSNSDCIPSVGPTPSLPLDSRDNQLDELVSQPLLSSPTLFSYYFLFVPLFC